VSPGDKTEVDDGPLVGNGSDPYRNSTLATPSYPIWPTEINLVSVNSEKLKLSPQSSVLRPIIKEAFDHIRQELLFDDAFPDPKAIPRVVRKCLVNAARYHKTLGGHNALAAAVHQRLLTDANYETTMGQLVSTITLH
jgi:hypothetical protein